MEAKKREWEQETGREKERESGTKRKGGKGERVLVAAQCLVVECLAAVGWGLTVPGGCGFVGRVI